MQVLCSTGAFTRSSDPCSHEVIVRYAQEIGEGRIDFRRLMQQLRAGGFKGALSLEARAIDQDGRVDLERIQTSLQFMRNLVNSEE